MDASARDGPAEKWSCALSEPWLQQVKERLGFLYIDENVKVYGGRLSLLKFLNELQKHPERAAALFECLLAPAIDESARIWHSLKRYCCYDKRTRLNYHEMFETIA